MKCAVGANPERLYFVTRQEAVKVLAACPDAQWRVIFALSRYAGVRCPSETLALRWGDVDWEHGRMTVRSPKTEHHEGKASRLVPIFPELRPYLLEAFDQAEPGSEYVVTRSRDGGANLRTQLERIVRRAGLTPWPKLFHNLRATRETELAESFPLHVVCAWIGNSQSIAARHYLQVTDEHFGRAIQESAQAAPDTPGEAGAGQDDPEPQDISQGDGQRARRAAQNPAHAAPIQPDSGREAVGAGKQNRPELPSDSAHYRNSKTLLLPPVGVEPT
jgi:hypothetical protein